MPSFRWLTDLGGKLSGWCEHQSLAFAQANIHLLQNSNREGGGLASTRLGLSDDIASLARGQDGARLNGGRLLKTVRVDTTQQLFPKLHVIEALSHFIVVGL